MATQCFCGCERTIPIYMLGLRTYNTRGKQVTARLAWLRDGLNEAGQTPDADEQGWLDEGDEIVRVIASVVHREADPRSVNERGIREWQAEGRAAEREQKLRMARLGRASADS